MIPEGVRARSNVQGQEDCMDVQEALMGEQSKGGRLRRLRESLSNQGRKFASILDEAQLVELAKPYSCELVHQNHVK